MAKLILSSFLILVLISANITAFADFGKNPEFTKIQDIYIPAKRPTIVNFDVTAVGGDGQPAKVECEHRSGHTFPMGKTKVLCVAKDIFGKETRQSFTVTIGYEIVKIPSWFKTTTKFWVNSKIDDKTFFNSVNYLVKNNIISMQTVNNSTDNTDKEIPSWVIDTARKWSANKTGDHEYSIALQWFIENGFVR